MVTSGRTLSARDTEHICEIYASLKENVNIRLCASLGLLTKEQLAKLKESGVERYHCNLETAPSFFPTLCSTHTTEEKLRTIGWAREVGMSICSGGIIGMGETAEQRVEFAVAVRDAGAVSVPVNVLNPIPGTPLEHVAPLTDEEVLTAIAMVRIVNPEVDVRLAGGRTVIRHIQEKALRCGVSALIVGDMLTTAGMDIDSDKAMFKKSGFEI